MQFRGGSHLLQQINSESTIIENGMLSNNKLEDLDSVSFVDIANFLHCKNFKLNFWQI